MGILSTIIGGAFDIFGGKQQNKYNHQQNQANLDIGREFKWFDYQKQMEFAKNSAGWRMDDLMDAADRSGIHRLAALGGTGAEYTGGQNVPSGTPKQSFLGDTVGKALDRMSRSREQKSIESVRDSQVKVNEAEAKLLEAQSRTTIANARAASRGQTGPTESVEEPDKITLAELLKKFEARPATVTNVGHKTDTKMPDAESWEARYGEILGEVRGFLNAINDTGRALDEKYVSNLYRLAVKDAAKQKNQKKRRQMIGTLKNGWNAWLSRAHQRSKKAQSKTHQSKRW